MDEREQQEEAIRLLLHAKDPIAEIRRERHEPEVVCKVILDQLATGLDTKRRVSMRLWKLLEAAAVDGRSYWDRQYHGAAAAVQGGGGSVASANAAHARGRYEVFSTLCERLQASTADRERRRAIRALNRDVLISAVRRGW